MSDPANRPARTGAALLVGPLLAVVLYLGFLLLLLLAFSALTDAMSRDRIWKTILFWAIYTLPSILAPLIAALLTGVFLGAAARRAAYWPILLLLLAFTAVTVIWGVLSGGFWGVLAGLLQAASTALAWHLLHNACFQRPEIEDQKLDEVV